MGEGTRKDDSVPKEDMTDEAGRWVPPMMYITKEQAERMQNEPLRCPFCEAGFLKKPLLPPVDRKRALEIYQTAVGPEYPLRWTTSRGDFPGRDHAIEVFNVPVSEQRPLLRRANIVRDEADRLAGGRCNFIMHTPEATKEHYSHLF